MTGLRSIRIAAAVGVIAAVVGSCSGGGSENETSDTGVGDVADPVADGGAEDAGPQCIYDSDCPGERRCKMGRCITQETDEQVPVDFERVSAGNVHACGVTTSREIECWGGAETYNEHAAPSGSMHYVASSGQYDCAIDRAGALHCWGAKNFEGRLKPPERLGFQSVDLGENHACAIHETGELVCWGLGSEKGEDEGFADFDQAVPPEGEFAAVAVGYAHTCAIGGDGTISCWGQGSDPQKEEEGNDYDQAVAPDGSFVDIEAGRHRTCGVTGEGDISCWGREYGTPPDGSFEQIAVGKTHACAIKADGGLVCWGTNNRGESDAPEGTFEQVSAGTEFACAVRDSSELICWGRDNHGQASPPYEKEGSTDG